MKRGSVVFVRKVHEYRFDKDGKRVMQLEYLADKGKYFALLLLDVGTPQELTEERLKESLQAMGWKQEK